MKITDVVDLLETAALIDGRNAPTEAVVDAWYSYIGDLDVADAQTALRNHMRESSERIMPVHIIRGVAEIREARLNAAGPWEEFMGDIDPYAPQFNEILRERNGAIARGEWNPRDPSQPKPRDGEVPPKRPSLPPSARRDANGPVPGSSPRDTPPRPS